MQASKIEELYTTYKASQGTAGFIKQKILKSELKGLRVAGEFYDVEYFSRLPDFSVLYDITKCETTKLELLSSMVDAFERDPASLKEFNIFQSDINRFRLIGTFIYYHLSQWQSDSSAKERLETQESMLNQILVKYFGELMGSISLDSGIIEHHVREGKCHHSKLLAEITVIRSYYVLLQMKDGRKNQSFPLVDVACLNMAHWLDCMGPESLKDFALTSSELASL
ncbi:hypothetical protein [Vibrio barjaei]|uniref:hypothetical protein n=1 Tax=Vibrio barjaei TaxID=1676683 RepID=UPI0022842A45|nr:hypothetical protein [Vibrio barjaei]MCY9872327.1 hypothetical protein [Vibrio barjaei]